MVWKQIIVELSKFKFKLICENVLKLILKSSSYHVIIMATTPTRHRNVARAFSLLHALSWKQPATVFPSIDHPQLVCYFALWACLEQNHPGHFTLPRAVLLLRFVTDLPSWPATCAL